MITADKGSRSWRIWFQSVAAAVGLLFLCAGSVLALEIEVTEVTGTVQGLRKNATIRFPITVGTILFACDRIFVQPNSSMKWKRRGSDCPNTGGTLNSDATHGESFHVGEDAVGPGAPSRAVPLAGPLAGGFADLETSQEAWQSQVTIEEGAACSGVNHCGLNSAIAQAAAVDATPQGMTTVFTGCLAYTEQGVPAVSFWSDPHNTIALVTTPLVGGHVGQYVLIQPGQNIVYDPQGNFTLGNGPLPCNGVEPPTVTLPASWGMVKSIYR